MPTWAGDASFAPCAPAASLTGAFLSPGFWYLQKNDAQDIASVLRQFSFNVLDCKDATLKAMGRALRDFREALYDADLGLFFFAGHGLQIEGKNYLLATDTRAEDEIDAKYSSILLDEIFESMEKSGTSTNLVILDACRDTPRRELFISCGTAR